MPLGVWASEGDPPRCRSETRRRWSHCLGFLAEAVVQKNFGFGCYDCHCHWRGH